MVCPFASAFGQASPHRRLLAQDKKRDGSTIDEERGCPSSSGDFTKLMGWLHQAHQNEREGLLEEILARFDELSLIFWGNSCSRKGGTSMSFVKLIRPMGLVSVFAGALIALAEILHPAGEDLAAVHSPLWTPAHLVWWFGVLLLQFGLMGLYARHAEALGRLGLTGFVLTFFGVGLTAGILFLQSAVPLIASRSSLISMSCCTDLQL
jgi:hypothetical protein